MKESSLLTANLNGLASLYSFILEKISVLLKDRLTIIHQKTLPEPYSTLFISMVFGTRAAKIPAEINEIYKKAGVMHLLVASGMQLSILAGVCLFAVRCIGLPLWLGALLTTVANLLFGLVAGFGPSILRSAIMSEIMLLGIIFDRKGEFYTSLSLAAFMILLFHPRTLFDIGFQLSFASTFSLVYVAPVISDRLKIFIPAYISALISAAIAPVFVTGPITLFHFSQVSLIGVVTNILLLPWVEIIVVLGFISTVLGIIFLPLCELVNGANLILLWLAHRIITTLAAFPFAQIFVAPPKLPVIIGYYAGLVLLIEVLRRGRLPKINRFRAAVIALAMVSVFLWNIIFSGPAGGLTITVLDVGQGDAIIIETPSKKRVLVDGGEEKMGERVVVPFLRRKGINKLDLVILTHPHDDHVGGLPAVLREIKVEAVLDPGCIYDSQAYRKFLDLVRRCRAKYCLARAGQRIDFGNDVTGFIFSPDFQSLEEANADVNNGSIVFRMQYNKFSMLFTGDSGCGVEQRILEGYPGSCRSSSVLKVGHHGSAGSTSDQFLSALDFKAAVISCGRRNKFRHPHQRTLERLKKDGITVHRTDKDGAIIIITDGKAFSIVPQK